MCVSLTATFCDWRSAVPRAAGLAVRDAREWTGVYLIGIEIAVSGEGRVVITEVLIEAKINSIAVIRLRWKRRVVVVDATSRWSRKQIQQRYGVGVQTSRRQLIEQRLLRGRVEDSLTAKGARVEGIAHIAGAGRLEASGWIDDARRGRTAGGWIEDCTDGEDSTQRIRFRSRLRRNQIGEIGKSRCILCGCGAQCSPDWHPVRDAAPDSRRRRRSCRGRYTTWE